MPSKACVAALVADGLAGATSSAPILFDPQCHLLSKPVSVYPLQKQKADAQSFWMTKVWLSLQHEGAWAGLGCRSCCEWTNLLVMTVPQSGKNHSVVKAFTCTNAPPLTPPYLGLVRKPG
jgi:hypothetical protein